LWSKHAAGKQVIKEIISIKIIFIRMLDLAGDQMQLVSSEQRNQNEYGQGQRLKIKGASSEFI